MLKNFSGSKLYFNRVVFAFSSLLLAGILFTSVSCFRGASNDDHNLEGNNAPNPSLNKKPLVAAMSFYGWQRSKPGMILSNGKNELFYLAAPGANPAALNEKATYSANTEANDDDRPENSSDDTSKPHRSHSGKFEVIINKINPRTEYSGCCAIQKFDYEIFLADVASPSERTKLADENWIFLGWSPDDKFILFADYGSQRRLILINTETKEKMQISPIGTVMEYVFIPNGKGLFFFDFNDATRLKYFDFASKQLTDILSLEGREPQMKFLPDDAKLGILFKVFRGEKNNTADNYLYLVDAKSKVKVGEYDLPRGVLYSGQWREDGQEFGFTILGASDTEDVYSVNTTDGKVIHWYPQEGDSTNLYK